jgi:hypothetical protein
MGSPGGRENLPDVAETKNLGSTQVFTWEVRAAEKIYLTSLKQKTSVRPKFSENLGSTQVF